MTQNLVMVNSLFPALSAPRPSWDPYVWPENAYGSSFRLSSSHAQAWQPQLQPFASQLQHAGNRLFFIVLMVVFTVLLLLLFWSSVLSCRF